MKTVLVVEDNPDIRDLSVAVLEGAGYAVESAANGEEALAMLGKMRDPCLVLLDLMMPVMDGRTFLRRLSEVTLHVATLPVVVLSAAVGEAVEGVRRVLRKPVSPEMLRKVVVEVCGPPGTTGPRRRAMPPRRGPVGG